MFDTYGVYWFSDKLYTYCRLSLRITVINYTITLKFLNSNPVGCGKVETWARRSNRSPGSWIITMNIIFNVFFYHCGLSLKEHINGKGKDVFANGNDFTLIQLSLWVIVTLGSTINGLSVKMTFKLPRGWYLIQIQDETKKKNLLLLHDERFWEQNTLDLQLTKWPLLWCQLYIHVHCYYISNHKNSSYNESNCLLFF